MERVVQSGIRGDLCVAIPTGGDTLFSSRGRNGEDLQSIDAGAPASADISLYHISSFEVDIDGRSLPISIKHRVASSISDVGQQLWRAAFLIADFLVDQRRRLGQWSIVELGCGSGLVGVVLSHLTHRGAYITDMSEDIIRLAYENVSTNRNAVADAPPTGHSNVHCRVIDWASESDAYNISPQEKTRPSEYRWTGDDMELLRSTRTLYVAADCVYDDDLTKLLFLKASALMKPRDVMVLALEKRYVSSFESRGGIEAHGYYVFLRHLNQIEGLTPLTYESPHFGGTRVRVVAERLDHASLPQYVWPYSRSDAMELWEVRFVRSEDNVL